MAEVERTMTRRDVLRWLAGAAAAGYAMPGACAWADDGPRKIASLFALRHGAAKEFEDDGVILVRSDQGIAAFPNICTHKRKTLSVDDDGQIYCPVHGSRFGFDGKPQNGPASRALKWYAVRVEESGAVFVDTGRSVDAGTWAALPEWARPRKQSKCK